VANQTSTLSGPQAPSEGAPFNIADLIETVADAVPDRTAIIAGEVRHSYGDLDARANRVGHVLRDAGVQPGDHVGIYAMNRAEWVETMLGCLKIQAVPVNVNFRYVEGELSYLFGNADLVALVVERRYLDLATTALKSAGAVRSLLVIEDGTGGDLASPAQDYEAALAGAPADRNFPPRSGDDHYLIYTGGTTGMPKGVLWRHEDLFFSALSRPLPNGEFAKVPEDLLVNTEKDPLVFLTVAPLMHGAAQLGVLIALTTAGTIALWTGRTFDPNAIWQLAAREHAVSITIVGDAMGRPLADALAADPAAFDSSSLFAMASAGAILTDAVREILKTHLPNVMMIDSYGATELGHSGTEAGGRGVFRMSDDSAVLDDDLVPVEAGSGKVGRIGRRGHIPLGYYGDPEKTASTFLIDGEGVRWVVPGDLATVRDDGSVELLGRGSTIVNTGGEKVFPEEVENAIASHPLVADVLVVGVPDDRYGERVAALVVLREGETLELDELRAHCRGRIAGYKTPREVHVVAQIQRSPAGKADYPWGKAQAQQLSRGSI
jgi:acyl-CoA synthetase (AMP-forming)/AMP-acid ligase II